MRFPDISGMRYALSFLSDAVSYPCLPVRKLRRFLTGLQPSVPGQLSRYGGADLTAPLFSVFLGGAVFFNFLFNVPGIDFFG